MKLNKFFLSAPAILSGTSMFETEWMFWESPRDLIIKTLLNRVRSLALHISSFVCNFLNLRLKLRSLFFFSSYEKWTPRIFTGLCIHFIFSGLDFLFAHFPSQIAFVFFTLSRRPAIFPKLPMILKAFSTEIKSAQNRFVSSANCDNLSSFPNKLIPLTVGSLRILIDNISAERMNRPHTFRRLKPIGCITIFYHCALYVGVECTDPLFYTSAQIKRI